MSLVTIGLCDLCSATGVPIRHALVAWKTPALPFGDVDRCEDEAQCRARIEARGDEWPLKEKAS